MPRPQTPRRRLAATLLLAALAAGPGRAAYVSELFQDGPAGQGIELTGIDPAQGATIAILNGSRFDPAGFGQALELIHLPPDPGGPTVVLVTDHAWPDIPPRSTPLADVPHASSQTTLALGGPLFDRLILVFDGETDLLLGDNPVTNAEARARYDADALTDWLSIGPGGLASAYVSSGLDVAGVNSALGIDLTTRTADRQTGRVIARAGLPGQPVDLDVLHVGDPDALGDFVVAGGWVYHSTPGAANVPLVHPAPEPGTAAALLGCGVLLSRRRRGA